MNKNEYSKIEDFLVDESFVRWIKEQSEEDAVIWKQWITANPGKKELINTAAELVKGIQFVPKKMDDLVLESALNKLNVTIDQNLEKQESITQRNITKRKFFRLIAGIAASSILILLSYKAISWQQQSKEVIYQTAYGERLDLKLADGTEVALNANSTLRFFSKNSREVWLEGEAFFKVEKKNSAGAKFLVHTAELDIEVLGTAFNVNSLMSETQVLLEEGKVKLKLANGTEETMQPGNLISYSGKTNKIIKKEEKVDAELHTSWKDGHLIFKSISLQEAMQRIEAIYGVEVIFEQAALAQRPSLHIDLPTKNLDICIRAIQKSMGLVIQQQGNQLIIREQD